MSAIVDLSPDIDTFPPSFTAITKRGNSYCPLWLTKYNFVHCDHAVGPATLTVHCDYTELYVSLSISITPRGNLGYRGRITPEVTR